MTEKVAFAPLSVGVVTPIWVGSPTLKLNDENEPRDLVTVTGSGVLLSSGNVYAVGVVLSTMQPVQG